MDWRTKAVAQGILSRIPGGRAANTSLQRLFGELRHVDAHIDSKIVDWIGMADRLRSVNIPFAGSMMVEIGTGWFPVFPVCCLLSGCQRLVTYDLNRLATRRTMNETMQAIRGRLDRIAASARCPGPDVRQAFQTLAEEVERAGWPSRIEYRAPADATSTGLANDSVDVIFSNSVLEHVPAAAIHKVNAEAYRILKPGGVAVHGVNCGDHYAYFDRGITPLHYLRFSEREWERWNNDLLFQNRLRAPEFSRMAAAAGFVIEIERRTIRHDLAAIRATLPIDASFQALPTEDLCCTSVDLVARKIPRS